MSNTQTSTSVNPRAARGKQIATTQRLDRVGHLWLVPSACTGVKGLLLLDSPMRA